MKKILSLFLAFIFIFTGCTKTNLPSSSKDKDSKTIETEDNQAKNQKNSKEN